MELIEGRCRVTLQGESAAREYRGGESFAVPGDSSFDIETLEPLHYVCHFG
jgi:purine/pyrimidine-nucleoside phosphorylase